MHRHPNEFSRRQIGRFFTERHVEVEVKTVDHGYVIFFRHFSTFEGCMVEEPAGRLIYDESRQDWMLFWISSTWRWHLYERLDRLDRALEVMFSDQAANLFRKVL